jgi:hypothetical protein
MKQFRLLVVPVVVVLAAVVTNVASADNGAQTTNFTAAYGFAALGQDGNVVCTETRIVKVAPKAFTKDSATCLVTDATYTPGTYPAAGIWYSDYEYFINPGHNFVRPAIAGDITIVDNGDGTYTWYVTAYY